MRDRLPGSIVCEPRHASWFAGDAEQALRAFGIGRAAVDPAVVPAAATPGGSDTVVYVRLHGSPRIYWSPYDDEALWEWLAAARQHPARERWIVFDNTAAGAAWADAVRMQTLARVSASPGPMINPSGTAHAVGAAVMRRRQALLMMARGPASAKKRVRYCDDKKHDVRRLLRKGPPI
jgi:uncharacterized protein YecE (DUF72 family)